MKTLTLLSIVWLLLQPLHAADPKPTLADKPTVMSVMIGGAFGRSYEVTYDGRELRYYAVKNFFDLKTKKAVVIKPTDAQWQALFDELERIKAWKWKRDYTNPNVFDGTSWRAIVSYETSDPCDLVSYGSNSYPPDFKAFLAAIQKLIGGKKFE